ncbi:NAD-dependent epimerase/dehydratase family protein [Streptomyces chartreusis]
MKIFLTGGSGYLGSALIEHLTQAGHQVLALARSQSARTQVAHLGAQPISGSLSDTEILRTTARESDAVIHAAVDFNDPAMHIIEQPALEALLSALPAGSPFIYTSSGMVYPDTQGRAVDEDSVVTPEASPQPHKVLGERQALSADGLAVTVIRAALIYGRGGSQVLQGFIAGGRQQGGVPYVGDGSNEWSSVHIDDLARLYLAVLDAAPRGLVLNASSPERTSMRAMTEAIAYITGAQATSLTPQQAEQVMGPFARVATRSSPMDSSRAERVLGWKATEPTLLEELRTGSYAVAPPT